MGVPFSNWAARVLLVASKEQNTPTEASFDLYDEDNGPGSDIGTAATGSHAPCLCGHAELPVASDGRRKAELCLLFCISAQAELCACFSAAVVPVGCGGAFFFQLVHLPTEKRHFHGRILSRAR